MGRPRKLRVTAVRKGKKITYKRKDVGAPGRTPEKERWFEAELTLHGWSKGQSAKVRHQHIREAIEDKGVLRTYNSLLGLANVTTDRKTEKAARADYQWMSREYAEELHRARVRAR